METFSIFLDTSNRTCEVLPKGNYHYTELTWAFLNHPSSVNLFGLVLSGTQPCASEISTWFVRGENDTGAPSECLVEEDAYENTRVCALTCQCTVPSVRGYLHYHVQFPSWLKTTVALCDYQLTTPYPGFIDPKLVIY